MIALMLPFFFLAMYEKDGQHAEKIIRNILRHYYWPTKRTYHTENLYRYLDEEGQKIEKPIRKTAGTSGSKPAASKIGKGGAKVDAEIKTHRVETIRRDRKH
jgi:hypothetical protein